MTKATKSTEAVEQFAADVQAKFDENAGRLAQGVAEYAEYAKESAAAFTKSAGVASKAAEKIQAEVLALTNQSVLDGVEIAKEAANAKNVSDLIQLQATGVTKGYGQFVAKAGAVGDVARGAVENAVEYYTDRMVAFANLANAVSARA